jgi:hypothetical protein
VWRSVPGPEVDEKLVIGHSVFGNMCVSEDNGVHVFCAEVRQNFFSVNIHARVILSLQGIQPFSNVVIDQTRKPVTQSVADTIPERVFSVLGIKDIPVSQKNLLAVLGYQRLPHHVGGKYPGTEHLVVVITGRVKDVAIAGKPCKHIVVRIGLPQIENVSEQKQVGLTPRVQDEKLLQQLRLRKHGAYVGVGDENLSHFTFSLNMEIEIAALQA